MTTANARSDYVKFLRSWMANPLKVSAVAPSGQSLARLMTAEISPGSGPVLELGPGTGVFTKALLARGVAEDDLTLVEFGADFAHMLEARFPRTRVVRMDATQLAESALFDGAPVGAVVSGLPLLSMSARSIEQILAGAFGYMREGGAFYQFTYRPMCPVPRPVLDRLGLKATLVGRTVRNIPPAAVYRVTQVGAE
ncbi:MAG: methyltransferase domain-containing protein [Burkholderiaceae bacterium]|nr:methyltransferase domain-containing protein [Burkholderiaceae bacterium]